MTDQTQAAKSGGSTLGLAIIYVTTLFFIWAVVTNLLDPLLAAMKTIFTLNTFEANLTNFGFFIAYFVVSIPAATFLARKGYANSLLTGVGGIILGCLIAILATNMKNYEIFLVALFTMASGITLLQVAANPLIAAMGDPKHSAFRLNLSQAFNSLGAASAIFLGAGSLLKGDAFKKGMVLTDALKDAALTEVGSVYFKIAIGLMLFLGAIFLVRKTISDNAPQVGENVSPLKALESKWAILGALAIFVYVGAEVSIGSNMVNYLEQDSVLGLEKEQAGKLTTYYMLLAMTGRFLGSYLLRSIHAPKLLSTFAIGAMAMCGLVIYAGTIGVSPATGTFHLPLVAAALPSGGSAIFGYLALLVGLFNSIMFPTIFTVTLERSSAPASATSGLLCVAIAGGAIIPLIFGQFKDASNFNFAYIVPLVCYGYILWFALSSSKAPIHKIEETVTSGH
ncbi:MAG: MFS transporter FHS family L-fucose permease [Hyphomonadaceae bacterium]|nr:MAG: MFS transporter FHS family L-fucose permease [Hyphomonadaceae bacterium]KAF0186778.1 MAG: MFS transporter FHS family L-fucose permease [Hyphomonadaceae bacterium]